MPLEEPEKSLIRRLEPDPEVVSAIRSVFSGAPFGTAAQGVEVIARDLARSCDQKHFSRGEAWAHLYAIETFLYALRQLPWNSPVDSCAANRAEDACARYLRAVRNRFRDDDTSPQAEYTEAQQNARRALGAKMTDWENFPPEFQARLQSACSLCFLRYQQSEIRLPDQFLECMEFVVAEHETPPENMKHPGAFVRRALVKKSKRRELKEEKRYVSLDSVPLHAADFEGELITRTDVELASGHAALTDEEERLLHALIFEQLETIFIGSTSPTWLESAADRKRFTGR